MEAVLEGWKSAKTSPNALGCTCLICRWIATNLLIDSLIKNWLTWIVGVNQKTRLLTPICPLRDNFLWGVYLRSLIALPKKSPFSNCPHSLPHLSVTLRQNNDCAGIQPTEKQDFIHLWQKKRTLAIFSCILQLHISQGRDTIYRSPPKTCKRTRMKTAASNWGKLNIKISS